MNDHLLSVFSIPSLYSWSTWGLKCFLASCLWILAVLVSKPKRANGVGYK